MRMPITVQYATARHCYASVVKVMTFAAPDACDFVHAFAQLIQA